MSTSFGDSHDLESLCEETFQDLNYQGYWHVFMVGDQLWPACNGKKLENQLGTKICHQNPQVFESEMWCDF